MHGRHKPYVTITSFIMACSFGTFGYKAPQAVRIRKAQTTKMMLKKWIPVLLSVIFCRHVENSLTEIFRNEHLVAVGNDSDGVAKLWITSKLFASTITVPLGLNLSISSAYNEQSSRSRELLVESSYTSTTTSLHHVFVPLENGVLNVTFMYNGSAAQDNETITVVQPHKLYRFGNPCPHMCASLGVYRIRGSLYYTLCAGSSGICRCQLSQRNQQQHIAIILLSNCRLLSYLINTDIIVQRISDVLSFTPIRTQSHLLFTLNKYIYQDDLVDGTYVNPIPFSVSLNCQVVLRIQITVNSKLLIYCANNTMVEYDFNTDYRSQFNNHLYFPCSETAKFLVNLTNNENADVHYFRMDDIPQRFPRQVRRFKLGECIEYEGHHLFLFTDWDNNLHLINSSMLTLYNISPSNQFARPLITGERYVVTYNPDNQTMSAFDLEDISSPIIIQQDIMPFQLATVISNLSMIVEIEPTPSSMVTFSPTSPYSILAPSISVTILVTDTMATSPEIEQELVIWPPIAIALAVIIVLCSGVVGTIGFIIYCYRRRKCKPPPPVIATSQTGRYEQDVLPTGAGIAISNLRWVRDSASCASMNSSRNTSGSEILAPATPLSESPLVGSSRCSSASPLCYSQGQESNYQQEVVVPIAETNTDEASSNASQPVVPGR